MRTLSRIQTEFAKKHLEKKIGKIVMAKFNLNCNDFCLWPDLRTRNEKETHELSGTVLTSSCDIICTHVVLHEQHRIRSHAMATLWVYVKDNNFTPICNEHFTESSKTLLQSEVCQVNSNGKSECVQYSRIPTIRRVALLVRHCLINLVLLYFLSFNGFVPGRLHCHHSYTLPVICKCLD